MKLNRTCMILILLFTSLVNGFSFTLPSDLERKDLDSTGTYNMNPRYLRPLGVHMGFSTGLVGDPVFLMLKANYFFIPQLETEINIGFKNISAGLKYHLNRTCSGRRFTPYTGILAGIERGTSFLLVPLGLRYIFPFGLSLSADLSQLIYLEYKRNEWMIGCTAGWNFRLRYR